MKFIDGLLAQLEVINALALRETRTRYGLNKLGYVWALVEPTLFILTFYIAFWLASREAPLGMTLFSFTTTGVIPYLIFTNTANQVAEAINGNKALLFYPQVNPLDVVAARIYLEFVTYSGVFLILLGVESLYLQRLTFDDPLLIAMGFVFASLFGGAVGLVFCALGQLTTAIDRARGPLLRPFFWVSGIFFTAASLPPSMRNFMLYNPVLHVVELTRAGFFERYDDRFVNPGYVATCILALLLVGLALMRVVRRRIEVT